MDINALYSLEFFNEMEKKSEEISMPKFEIFINENLMDSMCYDSGTTVCRYEDNGDIVEIEIRGYVTVDYNEDTYRHYTDMPEELKQMFRDGSAYDSDKVEIRENNWYEVFFNTDCQYDIADVDGYSAEQLKEYCEECMALFRG